MRQVKIGGGRSIWYQLGFGSVLLVYFAGSLLDVMDVDAAQYASISRDMLVSGNYLQVYERGHDYLDKPPLLFWFTALSFWIFGVSNFAYRIFPIFSTIIGAYATYRFGKLYGNKRVGLLSALVLVSCQAYFLIQHDVRTDTMLANSVIFAIWQIAEFNQNKRWLNLFGGFTGIAFAMLAKGPIGLMVPVLAFTTDFVLKRKWMWFIRWQWIVGLFIVALWLTPMSIGLYQQFDLHPEKVVNSRTDNSGLYFYFWKQSFGRLTGENDFVQGLENPEPIDPFFFVHSFIWSFLPWALLFFIALYREFQSLWRSRFKLNLQQEAICLGGVALPFIALTFSHFKLPHYIYVFFPLAAVMTGRLLHDLIYKAEEAKLFRWANGLLVFTLSILWLLGILLATWAFPLSDVELWAAVLMFLAQALFFVFRAKTRFEKLIMPALLSIVGVNLLLNAHVYPSLFEYQSGSVIARYARYEADIPPDRFFVFSDGAPVYMPSLDFYSRRYIGGELGEVKNINKISKEGECWVLTTKEALPKLQKVAPEAKVIKEFVRFHISELTLPFLNPKTRAEQLMQLRVLYIPKVN